MPVDPQAAQTDALRWGSRSSRSAGPRSRRTEARLVVNHVFPTAPFCMTMAATRITAAHLHFTIFPKFYCTNAP